MEDMRYFHCILIIQPQIALGPAFKYDYKGGSLFGGQRQESSAQNVQCSLPRVV